MSLREKHVGSWCVDIIVFILLYQKSLTERENFDYRIVSGDVLQIMNERISGLEEQVFDLRCECTKTREKLHALEKERAEILDCIISWCIRRDRSPPKSDAQRECKSVTTG